MEESQEIFPLIFIIKCDHHHLLFLIRSHSAPPLSIILTPINEWLAAGHCPFRTLPPHPPPPTGQQRMAAAYCGLIVLVHGEGSRPGWPHPPPSVIDAGLTPAVACPEDSGGRGAEMRLNSSLQECVSVCITLFAASGPSAGTDSR